MSNSSVLNSSPAGSVRLATICESAPATGRRFDSRKHCTARLRVMVASNPGNFHGSDQAPSHRLIWRLVTELPVRHHPRRLPAILDDRPASESTGGRPRRTRTTPRCRPGSAVAESDCIWFGATGVRTTWLDSNFNLESTVLVREDIGQSLRRRSPVTRAPDRDLAEILICFQFLISLFGGTLPQSIR